MCPRNFTDATGVLTKEEFDFDTDELYKTFEFGWSPGRDQRYFKNVHVTLWQVDEREEDEITLLGLRLRLTL